MMGLKSFFFSSANCFFSCSVIIVVWLFSVFVLSSIIFIDNAIKYNNKENIEIEIKLENIKNQFKLVVKDNGIGIHNDEIKNVMKRFYKVDKSRVNNNSFGIGLAIANRIVNNYKAKIEIKSELDKYTIINVYFER